MPESPLSPRLFKFLSELEKNNNRDWFAEQKSRYERDVREPSLRLIEMLEPPLAKAAPMLQAIAKKSGGSLMRIYRDTRFSKDKTPYKTNVGISLRHQAGCDIHAPGAYVHFATDECFVAAGCWRPERNTLAAIRSRIDVQPDAWKRARNHKALKEHFQLAGERLKTAPRGFAKDHPLIDDLRRIDFIAVSPVTRKQLTSGDPVELIISRIKAARSLMRFLCDAIDVPY